MGKFMKILGCILIGILIGNISCAIFMIYKLGFIVEKEKKDAAKFKEYFKVLDQLTQIEMGKKDICLDAMNISSVAVYGRGVLGIHLINVLNMKGIKVKYIIDKGKENIYSQDKIVDLKEPLLDIDAIIITPFMEYKEICVNIEKYNSGIEMIDVRNLLVY